jgi:LytS/YehU family sensor histidine kinase
VNFPFESVLRTTAMKSLVWNVVTYSGVLAAAHALEYYRRFREREVAAAQLTSQLATAQLAALKMQLHPHFLFNTLHAIAVLVRKQDTQGSVRMITGLSDLLRLVLDSDGQQLVPLKQELDFISRYLDIERVRFADRLRVTTDIAHDTLDAQVPYLVLQPLVENAIRHGISSRVGAGELEIVARRAGGNLLVTIRDDGAGVRPSSTPGLGLRNVRARLEQLYPGRHRLTLEDDARGGAIVTLEMPFSHG